MASPVRRSTRGALPTSKVPPPPASTASSSSLSSGRQDRSGHIGAHQKSATPHSLSSEDAVEQPRRSQRSQPTSKHEEAIKDDDEQDEDRAEDEEEVTRCVCGHQEYPGPPLSEAFSEIDAQSEDAGGLFISCDGCSVWQHGGCVGIVEDNQVPDKYYCEECRPKQHDLRTDSRGQRYSLYVPLHHKSSRKQSTSKHGEKAQKEREATVASRSSADPIPGRRRATMRSKEHDDEEEQFLRAIEESRRDVESTAGPRRVGKRSREDSEDNKHEIKRQRTASESLPSITRLASMDGESEEDDTTTSRGKKARAEAAQLTRQAEAREKEKERDKARAEAAGRRQERAGRRRADEPEQEETPKPTSANRSPQLPSSQPPSPPAQPAPDKAIQKKGVVRKTKKLGNNQYTKNREIAITGASPPHAKKRNPTNTNGSSSGDEQLVNGDGGGTGANKNSPNHEQSGLKGKLGKGKGKVMNGNNSRHNFPQDPSELTISDMARQVTAMAAFLTKAQVDVAGDVTPPTSDLSKASRDGNGSTLRASQVPDDANPGFQFLTGDGRKFEDLTAMEMADVLSRNMSFWESRFAPEAHT